MRAVDACHMVRSDLMMTCDMVRRGFDNVKPLLTITSSQASTYQTDACDMVYVRKCVTCDRVRGVVHVSRLSGVFIAKQEQNALLYIQEPVTPPMVHLDWCHFPYQGYSHSHTCNT